jgi:beta-lactam-binding protein with PASTA domain
VLPPTTAGGGGGAFIVVPDVVGRTVGEAKRIINAAELSIGSVTVREQRAMLDPIIGVARAESENDATVIDQSPNAGTQATPGDPVDVTAEFSVPIPEPASLVLFATGLAFIVLVMMRRRGD